MRVSTERKIRAGFGLGVLVLAVSAGMAYRTTERLLETGESLDRSYRLIETLDRTLSQLRDAEAGQGGFLLTGEERDLGAYRTAVAALDGEQRELRRLTAGDPARERRVAEIGELVARRLAELDETVDRRRRGGRPAARAVVQTGRGAALTDALVTLLTHLEAEERAILQTRHAGIRRTVELTHLLNLGVGLIAVLLLVGLASFTVRLLTHDRAERRRAEAAEREAATLRATAELASAAAHEINNPMTIILTHLEILKDAFPPDAPSQVRLVRVSEAAARIVDIVSRMSQVTTLRGADAAGGLAPMLDLRRSSAEPTPDGHR